MVLAAVDEAAMDEEAVDEEAPERVLELDVVEHIGISQFSHAPPVCL